MSEAALLRRGFKSDANWYARDVRRDFGLPPHEPLCPWMLADHLGFKVLTISEFLSSNPLEVAFLGSARGQKEFSAITICIGSHRLIVHNDYHAEPRQAADISHELAHGLLLHPAKPLTNEFGVRQFNAVHEEEASWLGPALLVSDEAAVHIAGGRYRYKRRATCTVSVSS